MEVKYSFSRTTTMSTAQAKTATLMISATQTTPTTTPITTTATTTSTSTTSSTPTTTTTTPKTTSTTTTSTTTTTNTTTSTSTATSAITSETGTYGNVFTILAVVWKIFVIIKFLYYLIIINCACSNDT